VDGRLPRPRGHARGSRIQHARRRAARLARPPARGGALSDEDTNLADLDPRILGKAPGQARRSRQRGLRLGAAEQAAFVDTVLPMLAELAGQDRRPRPESIDVLIPSGAPRMARRDGKEVRVRHVVGATACNLP